MEYHVVATRENGTALVQPVPLSHARAFQLLQSERDAHATERYFNVTPPTEFEIAGCNAYCICHTGAE